MKKVLLLSLFTLAFSVSPFIKFIDLIPLYIHPENSIKVAKDIQFFAKDHGLLLSTLNLKKVTFFEDGYDVNLQFKYPHPIKNCDPKLFTLKQRGNDLTSNFLSLYEKKLC